MDRAELYKKSRQFLRDAEILIQQKRCEGAVYLLGYVLELSLKNSICKKLQWNKYPPGNNFNGYQSFKTHNLEILLNVSGKAQYIKRNLLNDWSNVSQWNPESRYTYSKVIQNDAITILNSTKTIIKKL